MKFGRSIGNEGLRALIVTCTAIFAGSSQATVLHFFDDRPDGDPIPADYGSAVSIENQIYPYSAGNGYTPDVSVDFNHIHSGTGWRVGGAGGRWLLGAHGVAWLDGSAALAGERRTFELVLTPEPGFGVDVNQFELVPSLPGAGAHEVAVEIWGGNVGGGTMLANEPRVIIQPGERKLMRFYGAVHPGRVIVRIKHLRGDPAGLALDEFDFDQRQVFTVTNTADDRSDGSLRKVLCDLRRIHRLAMIVMHETVIAAGSITLGSEIADELTGSDVAIVGPGAHRFRLSSVGRLFSIVASVTKLELVSLGIEGCEAPVGGAVRIAGGTLAATRCRFVDNRARGSVDPVADGASGGAICVESGALFLTDCEFSGNSAQVAGEVPEFERFMQRVRGGAIYIDDGDVAIDRCLFADNFAHIDVEVPAEETTSFGDAQGGAVFSRRRDLIIRRSFFHSNRATVNIDAPRGDARSTAQGGAVFYGGGDTLTLSACTFYRNQATATATALEFGDTVALGGALATDDAKIVNGTFIENGVSAAGEFGRAGGGAIYVEGGLELIHATVVGNGGDAHRGGGIEVGTGDGIAATNCLIAANLVSVANPDIESNPAISSGGGNQIGDGGTSSGWIETDGVGDAAEPLPAFVDFGYHGGPVPTARPDETTPHVDGGVPIADPCVDARGFDRVFGSAPDVGAIELDYQHSPPLWWSVNYDLDPSPQNAALNDTDCDGFADFFEFFARTDPRDPSSVLKVHSVRRVGGVEPSLELCVQSLPGVGFVFWTSDDLWLWRPVLGIDTGSSYFGTKVFSAAAEGAQGYSRIGVVAGSFPIE